LRSRLGGRGRTGCPCAALLISALLCLAAAPAAAPGAGKRIHISGIAYAFDNQLPIAGAKIRVAELPGAKATTAADGSYDLTVPDGAKVTPYISAAGFHGIYLQTFVAAGRDLPRVNFQIPSVGIYHGLAALLGVKLDANDNPSRCVIVSTFSTVNIRGLSFPDFIAYGAHGVAGATASASPALPDPIYFNSSVIPDVTLTESSVDGGVIWLDVPAGVYRLSAQHATDRFAGFIASCKPGRLVNANPPQGLFGLKPGEKADNRVEASIASAHIRTTEAGSRVLRLRLRSQEYVLPEAEILQAGSRIADKRVLRFRRGSRTLSIALGRKLDRGQASLRLTLADPPGNTIILKRKLQS
jgi:hypothetical protein